MSPTASARALAACRHCGDRFPAGPSDFCCAGCETVFGLLHDRGLERYYEIRGTSGVPVGDPAGVAVHAWLEPIAARLATSIGSTRVELDLQGLHCAACVWLLEELFRRRADGAIEINPARGTAALTVSPGFDLAGWVVEVEAFGYRLGPSLKRGARPSDRLLLKTAIAIAIAGNAMMFSTAIYLGLASGPIYRLFHVLLIVFATLAVVLGAPVFARSAVNALRRGVLHLDLPIALGILLAYLGSLAAEVVGEVDGSYFDTLAIFIALMLLGRWLQQRVIEQNRDRLLASEGAEGLLCRRLIDDQVEIEPAGRIVAGDRLLVAPGDLVPVDARLDEPAASLSLDWVTGESQPRTYGRGERIPAGAFNLDRQAARVIAEEPFSASRLIALLARPSTSDLGGPEAARLARAVSGWYVASVLVAALLGAIGWYAATRDLGRAIVVAASVLIITCPCAFGIAAPLAWELALAGLRRAGLFVQRASFLDRARDIRRIVFDKTGTLTTGVPELAEPERLARLTPGERAALYDLAARSSHPRSVAVARALRGRLRREVVVDEFPGLGLEATIDGIRYRFGAPAWVAGVSPIARPSADDAGDAPLAFGPLGTIVLALETHEAARPDAARELAHLASSGYELWILSGDRPGRVAALAEQLGVPAARALGGQTPEDKAAFLAAHDRRDTLFLGDGVNDAPAARAAFASGTPAIDRPFMAALTDFYLVTPGIAPIARALDVARALGKVLRRNFTIALAYNVLGVGLAWSGLLGPLTAAVLMPASSISIVALTTWSLSPRSSLWRSSTSSSS